MSVPDKTQDGFPTLVMYKAQSNYNTDAECEINTETLEEYKSELAEGIKVCSIKKKNRVLSTAFKSVGFYALINIALFPLYFYVPSLFQWTLFENWTSLVNYQVYFNVLNSTWFALVITGIILVVVGIIKKRANYLNLYLVLVVIEFSQIIFYSSAFFIFILVRGLFEENNYFNVKSTFLYIFLSLATTALALAFLTAYFYVFIVVIYKARVILKSNASEFQSIPII